MYQYQYVCEKALKWLNELEEHCSHLFVICMNFHFCDHLVLRINLEPKRKLPGSMAKGLLLSFLTFPEPRYFLFLRRTAPAAGNPALSFSYWLKAGNRKYFENLLIEECGGREALHFYMGLTPLEHFWAACRGSSSFCRNTMHSRWFSSSLRELGRCCKELRGEGDRNKIAHWSL